MPHDPNQDLIVLTPGKDEAAVVRAMLSRPRAVGIRPVTAEFQQHPDRDAGCRLWGHEFLRRESRRFQHALVLFDREGCGAEDVPREQLESEVEQRFAASGWQDRAAAIAIVPELEVWVWDTSAHVEKTLGWTGHVPTLREWLVQKGFLRQGVTKPERPKEAMEQALRLVGKKRSAATYGQLALKLSFSRCTDPAFAKLRGTLQRWFPREQSTGPDQAE